MGKMAIFSFALIKVIIQEYNINNNNIIIQMFEFSYKEKILVAIFKHIAKGLEGLLYSHGSFTLCLSRKQ